jgi:hypothetical protein
MRARGQSLDADAPALQVADVADRLAREQLVAAGVQAGERGQRQAGVQLIDDGAAETRAEVHVAARDHLRRAETAFRFDVAHVDEAFGAQERLGHVHWGETMEVVNDRRIAGVSGGASSATDARVPRRLALAANEALVRKSRRDCMICMRESPVLSPASISNRVASASGLIAGATAARTESVIRLSPQQHAMIRGLRKARRLPENWG